MVGSQSRARDSKTSGRMKFIIPTAIILLVVAWLIYTNVQSSSMPYWTVAELKAGGPSERIVRVIGSVVHGTIRWDAQQLVLQFELGDDSGSRLSVTYKGVRPDLLVDGTRTLVEGKYTTSGIFQATKILLKCPSKYEEE